MRLLAAKGVRNGILQRFFLPSAAPPRPDRPREIHFLSLSACFWHSNEMKKAVRSDVKTCRYFLQAAAVGVTKPTSQQTLGGRPPPYGKLGKSLSSFSKRQTGGPSFLYNLTSTCNYFLILPKILHKKRRGKENRFPIENQWASFFTSFFHSGNLEE